MPRVATKLTSTKNGGFTARKRIPEDVQDAYADLYGARWEARLTLDAMPATLARARHREWLTEIESRIRNLRAETNGEGRSLTPKEARALSGEWYRWYLEKHQVRPQSAEHWEFVRDQINEALADAVGPYRDHKQEIDDVWEVVPEARQAVRPMLADWCETAQFLASRLLVLDNASRELFLDALYEDFGQALRLLIRTAKGDYSPDTWPQRFPKFETVQSTGLTPWQLFERWITSTQPAISTVDRWRGVFLQLEEHFSDRTAASITAEEAQEWAASLANEERGPRTVKDVWVVAARTVFAWAVKHKLLARNAFTEVHVSVPRSSTTRETKGFRTAEAQTILRAALMIADTTQAGSAAKRWVPWICAYTGARSGEITQLRGSDVIYEDGVDAIRITPDAGTVKTKQARLVPLHAHLIEQGFLSFAASKGKGPLFYNEPKTQSKSGVAAVATNPVKPRSVKTREHLAAWVREIGVSDPNVKPNHAWRHTFKQTAARHGITESMSDYITGHAAASVARGYAKPSLADMAKALESFPRYEV